jgi:hypothetical protein
MCYHLFCHDRKSLITPLPPSGPRLLQFAQARALRAISKSFKSLKRLNTNIGEHCKKIAAAPDIDRIHAA